MDPEIIPSINQSGPQNIPPDNSAPSTGPLPPMQQQDHPAHNMPPPAHHGTKLPTHVKRHK